MKVIFSKGSWNEADFFQVRSLLNKNGWKKFVQLYDCIVNGDGAFERGSKEYEYISLLFHKKFKSPVYLETECDFEDFGAPLLVFSDDVTAQSDGVAIYGHHFEVVAFEEGFNIWELNKTNKPIKVAEGRFPVPAKEKLTLSAKIDAEKNEIEVTLAGISQKVTVPNMSKEFYAGITACEGINHFYSFEAEEF